MMIIIIAIYHLSVDMLKTICLECYKFVMISVKNNLNVSLDNLSGITLLHMSARLFRWYEAYYLTNLWMNYKEVIIKSKSIKCTEHNNKDNKTICNNNNIDASNLTASIECLSIASY